MQRKAQTLATTDARAVAWTLNNSDNLDILLTAAKQIPYISSLQAIQTLTKAGVGGSNIVHQLLSFVLGAYPPRLADTSANSVVFDASEELEHQYNMDPTSLILIALELLDIRKDKEEAFEYLLWVRF